MPEPDRDRTPSLLRAGRSVKEIIEIATTVISAGSAVYGFIRSVGGFAQFLTEVAVLGFACYVACFVALPVVLGAFALLERATGRTTTRPMLVGSLAVGILGFGLLFRFALFAPNVTKDLDTIGKAFTDIVGVVILIAPLVAFWYLKGSKPRATRKT